MSGNLVYHNGTDWGSAALSWPIPSFPETAKVTGLTIPFPQVDDPDPAYVAPDPRAGYQHGFIGESGFVTDASTFWPHMAWETSNTLRMKVHAPSMPKDTAETRYNLWWRRSYYQFIQNPDDPYWRVSNKGLVALVHNASQPSDRRWVALFISIPLGYYHRNPPSWPDQTTMLSTYFNNAWCRTYINICYTRYWDANTYNWSNDWPDAPYCVRDTPFFLAKFKNDEANGMYENDGSYQNKSSRSIMINYAYVETSDFEGA